MVHLLHLLHRQWWFVRLLLYCVNNDIKELVAKGVGVFMHHIIKLLLLTDQQYETYIFRRFLPVLVDQKS